MKITDITAFVTLVLAISLASERLVTTFKTVIPWLASTPNPAQPVDPPAETARKIIVLLLTILCSWFTAAFLSGWKWTLSVAGVTSAPTVLLGLFASAGSSFWSSILGYVKAVKDIKVQKSLQEKINTDLLIAAKKK